MCLIMLVNFIKLVKTGKFDNPSMTHFKRKRTSKYYRLPIASLTCL